MNIIIFLFKKRRVPNDDNAKNDYCYLMENIDIDSDNNNIIITNIMAYLLVTASSMLFFFVAC